MYSFSVLRGRPGPHRTQGLLLGPVLLQFLGPPSLSLQCHPLPTAHTALLSSQCLPFLGLNKFMISMSLQWPTSSISSSPDLYFQPPSGHTTCLSHNTADSIHIPMQLIIFPPKLASHPPATLIAPARSLRINFESLPLILNSQFDHRPCWFCLSKTLGLTPFLPVSGLDYCSSLPLIHLPYHNQNGLSKTQTRLDHCCLK